MERELGAGDGDGRWGWDGWVDGRSHYRSMTTYLKHRAACVEMAVYLIAATCADMAVDVIAARCVDYNAYVGYSTVSGY